MRTIGVVGALIVAGSVVAAQKPAVKPAGIPRLADGRPDLQGNWTNATITPLERLGANLPLVLTEEAARDEERKTRAALEFREQDSDPNRPAPPVGGEQRKSPNAEPTYLERVWQGGAGVVGGYNSFWIAPGEHVLRVDGQPRSSILIDPPNGRVPGVTNEAKAVMAKAAAVRKSQGSEFDHPELRPNAERCLTSFGRNAGPPMLPNYFYNNNYTIVQTRDHVMIMTEMVHDVRIIRLGVTGHPPPHIRFWMGDSIGRWEGDTLVIETTNIHPLQLAQSGLLTPYRGVSENLKVIERLTRTGPDTLLYRFTMEDPSTFTAPVTGELPFNRIDEMIHEYACHEGNYAMTNILAGERAKEKRDAEQKKPQR
jgi:hypothetical protein